MPHFKTDDGKHISYTDEVIEAVNKIPKQKLILLDNNKLKIEGDIIQIYQDFENDIYNALKEGLDKITSYGKLILVYSENSIYPSPRRILHGFRKFCVEYDLSFEIIDKVFEDMVIKKGDLFITLEDNDLVYLIKLIRENNYSLGKEIGIISCDDTSLKELLGITVISTDFKAMSEKASQMILNNENGIIKNPYRFIDRNSI
jgi:DNA-binding LacI/PurR family transcriptional regulator